LERLLLLCDKANERTAKQTAKFRRYLEAQTQRDFARDKTLELPDDSGRQASLKLAVEELDLARADFAQTLGTSKRRHPSS
jgi:hypothetical protein